MDTTLNVPVGNPSDIGLTAVRLLTEFRFAELNTGVSAKASTYNNSSE